MTKKVPGLILIFLFAAMNSFADNYFVGSRQFMELMENYKQSCNEVCQKPFHQIVLYKHGKENLVLLSKSELKAFKKIANNQAYIWIDTILEDNYHADGDTKIEEIVGVFRSGDLVGYKVRYFEKAWYIGGCRYDGDVSTLSRCLPGVIKETSFVSTDFKTYVRNNDEIATFYY